ncbi:hypothetical protein H5410_037307 [Solanum commersonii]|uniref:Uncharacterized protein n=1 Tax=Solanum commersonii TaxID=4109 RepID=A0A9J5Y5W7_SOLCO|nr:hypothetical protein H5410_037307 [Solanum commersonii]
MAAPVGNFPWGEDLKVETMIELSLPFYCMLSSISSTLSINAYSSSIISLHPSGSTLSGQFIRVTTYNYS